jgi:hypothetical protein
MSQYECDRLCLPVTTDRALFCYSDFEEAKTSRSDKRELFVICREDGD